MLVGATKYADVAAHRGRGAAATAPRSLNLLLPKPGEVLDWPEWWWQELRQGGYLQRYLDYEKKHLIPRQIRTLAEDSRNLEQPKKSEFRRLARIPMRLFLRWRQEDPDFWSDRSNLKSLKRDNPELAIWL